MLKLLVVSLAVTACAALSTHIYARDLRACLSIRDVDQRVECLEGRAQPQPDTTVPAAAPNFTTSFDCKKAASPIEILICSDSVLAQIDAQMGHSYLGSAKKPR